MPTTRLSESELRNQFEANPETMSLLRVADMYARISENYPFFNTLEAVALAEDLRQYIQYNASLQYAASEPRYEWPQRIMLGASTCRVYLGQFRRWDLYMSINTFDAHPRSVVGRYGNSMYEFKHFYTGIDRFPDGYETLSYARLLAAIDYYTVQDSQMAKLRWIQEAFEMWKTRARLVIERPTIPLSLDPSEVLL